MENWKTTVSAVVTAFFGFIVFSPETFESLPWLISLAKFGAAGGMVAFGICAADKVKE